MTAELPDIGAVEVVRSPRARRIALTVRPSGSVRLSYPYGVSREQALQFLAAKRAWVLRARERLAARRAALPAPLPPEEERARIERLRSEAKRDLPPRLERLAEAARLHYEKVTIRAARTKWGSCTGRNHISLSLYLMLLPEQLRDFVLLHELCHTVHHDHSPRFHALLDRLAGQLLGGGERELQRELRRYAVPFGTANS